jgi:hypothetical protein
MTGEEIRKIITSDYEKAKSLLESNRFFRVTLSGEDGESSEFDSKYSSQAIEVFEDKRDNVKECFLDVMAEAVEFKGQTFPATSNEIANHQDQRLRKESNYVAVQQFNRTFISRLLESAFAGLSEQEDRIARKILAELLQIDYPL